MNDPLKMLNQTTYADLGNATSSQGSGVGAMLSDSLDGPMIEKSGLEVVLVNLSPRQAKESGWAMTAIYGPHGFGSLGSANLQLSLELTQRLDTGGSILYRLTWKMKNTTLGRRFYAQQASGHRIKGQDCTLLPTPNTSEIRDCASPQALARADRGGRLARWICSRSYKALLYWGTVSLNPSFARWMMGLSPAWDELVPTEMQLSHKLPPSSLKVI